MRAFVLVAVAAALLLFVFLNVVKSLRRRSSGKLPPSPPSLPLVGHLHLIGRLPHRSLHQLHLRHAAAEKQLYGGGNVSFAPYGELWRRAKKVAVVHLLSPRRAVSFAPVRAAEAAAMVARAARAAGRGEAVELRELLYGYTNAVVTRAATGAAGATADRLKRLLGHSATLVTGLQADDVLPAAAARLVRRAAGVERKIDAMVGEWDRFLSEIVAEHKEKSSGEDDFLDVLLRLREEEGADGLELTDNVIKSTVKDMIAAATETTSVTLEWAMAEMVGNPRVMAKLQDEIARVAGSTASPTEAELGRMGYLRAVVKEVLRLHPPAPLLLPHESTAAVVLQGGYEIPAKTALFVNVWAIGRDPAAWDEPEEFWPERFVAGGGSAVDFRGTDYQLLPFGAGRRMCPGINFALPVVDLALASLLHHFDWSLPSGMRPEDLDMAEAPGLTTPRRAPLVLVPRRKTLS